MIQGICSHCNEDFMNCRCEQFHPNHQRTLNCPNCGETAPTGIDYFVIERNEVAELMKFFMNIGYIDYEVYSETHKIIKRMHRFIQ